MDLIAVGNQYAANEVAVFPFVQTVLVLLAVALGYAVIARGLFLVTDPARHSLLEIADELTSNPKFPEGERAVMEYALDKVYSSSHAWRMALDTIILTLRFALRAKPKRQKNDYDPSFSKTYTAFQLRWIVSVFGNSLGASIVFLAFMMLLAAFAMSAGAIARLLMHRNGNGHNGTATAH